MSRGTSCVIAALLGACGFTVSPGGATDDAPLADAPLPDAGECMGASRTCANGVTLRTCGSTGVASDTTCLWGCKTGTPDHCGGLVPSGGAVVATDLELAGVSDVVVGNVTINGDTGIITGPFTGQLAWKVVAGIAVFRASSFRFNGPITLAGSRPLAFAAAGDIIVAGPIDVRGPCTATAAGPGGGAGGAFHTNGGGIGGGVLGPLGNGGGAGGGGYGAVGGKGGNGDGIGGTGGVVYGDAAITVLVGGSGGGGGGGGGGNEFVGRGGGGGGAIQLASNRLIRIEVAGVINAGGCGGHGSNNDANDGSGGGGSGGAILLEAPVVEIGGAIAVNGGGGGGCELVDGAPGGSTRSAAPGGNALNDGGPGGFALGLGGGLGASDALTGGGGGGGVGRIRVNTRTGVVSAPGTLSPGFDDVPTTATRATANVQ